MYFSPLLLIVIQCWSCNLPHRFLERERESEGDRACDCERVSERTDWWQGRQTNRFNGWLNKLNLNSYSGFHLLPDYWKKESFYKLDNRGVFEVSHYFGEKHPNATLQGDCCLFQIKIIWQVNTTQCIGSLVQHTTLYLCRWHRHERRKHLHI